MAPLGGGSMGGKASEELEVDWEGVIDLLPDVVAVIDRDFRLRHCNKSLCRRLGKHAAELRGEFCYRVLHGTDRPPDSCPYQMALAGENPAPVEMELVPLGGVFVVSVLPLAGKDGKIAGCLHVGRDVTALRRAEQQVREERRFLAAALEAMDDAFMVIDAGHRVLYANQRARTNDGDHCYQLSHHRTSPCQGADHPCPLAEVKRKGGQVVVRHQHHGVDGSPYPVEIVATPVTGDDGRFLGIVEVGRDLRPRLAAEEERRLLLEQVFRQQKEAAVCRLAGGLAHLYNNLLMGVLGNVELLDGQLADADLRRYTSQIRQAGLRMADLTRQILLYAKAEGGVEDRIDVNDLVNNLLDLTRRQLPAGIAVERRLEDGLWPVAGDRRQLLQVLTALVDNGCEAMAHGGILTVTTENRRLARPWRCGRGHRHPAGDWVAVTVTDQGPGIEPADLDHLFDPFFSRKFLGRGLGLAVADSVVSAHQGCIHVQDSGAGGTVMTVLLPRLVAKEEPPAVAGEATAASRRLRTVLVVDDEPELLSVLDEMLAGEAETVVTAATGGEALAAAEEHRATLDLVVLDIQLPDTDGLQVRQSLRHQHPGLAIILTSGHDRATALGDTVLAQCEDFLHKPFDGEALLDAVRRLAGGRE